MSRLAPGIAALCAVVAAAGLVGCGEADPLIPDAELQFELVMWDGQDVPFDLPNGGSVLSGSFTLHSDGRCQSALSYRVSSTADVTEMSLPCSWTGAPSAASVAWDYGATGDASLTGSQLTVVVLTGIVCITTPCPSTRTEVYEQLD